MTENTRKRVKLNKRNVVPCQSKAVPDCVCVCVCVVRVERDYDVFFLPLGLSFGFMNRYSNNGYSFMLFVPNVMH